MRPHDEYTPGRTVLELRNNVIHVSASCHTSPFSAKSVSMLTDLPRPTCGRIIHDHRLHAPPSFYGCGTALVDILTAGTDMSVPAHGAIPSLSGTVAGSACSHVVPKVVHTVGIRPQGVEHLSTALDNFPGLSTGDLRRHGCLKLFTRLSTEVDNLGGLSA